MARSDVRHPVPVVAVLYTDLELSTAAYTAQLDRMTARWDDVFWSRYTRRPFTWQRFLNWWVARRWVVPRDIRKE